jgi:hypothetical protein
MELGRGLVLDASGGNFAMVFGYLGNDNSKPQKDHSDRKTTNHVEGVAC